MAAAMATYASLRRNSGATFSPSNGTCAPLMQLTIARMRKGPTGILPAVPLVRLAWFCYQEAPETSATGETVFVLAKKRCSDKLRYT